MAVPTSTWASLFTLFLSLTAVTCMCTICYLHHQKRLGLCLPLAPELPETAAAAAAAGACHWGGLTSAHPAVTSGRYVFLVRATVSYLLQ